LVSGSERKPVAGLPSSFPCGEPVTVAGAFSLFGSFARPVQDGLDFLDAGCVLLDVQGGGAHPGARVFLKLHDLAAELLVKLEPDGAGADSVQRRDAGLLVRRLQPGQDGIEVRRVLAAMTD
jgi:hypothetical protein